MTAIRHAPKFCPTESIVFGRLDDLRARGAERVQQLHPTETSVRAFTQRKSRLELGHVLFIDIAGYSKRTSEEESEALPELNRIVGD